MRPIPAGGKFRCAATLERELRARGFHAVAGVDEVGRGALFGAVFAAAVILSEDRPVRGLNDSKLLEPQRREVLAERIRERAVAWAIGAASILAKVQRDACMRAWDRIFPEYGLAAHKGYATAVHCRALEQYGPTPLHRLSFEPVRAQSRFP